MEWERGPTIDFFDRKEDTRERMFWKELWRLVIN